MNVTEFRQKYPQYNDIDDNALADSLYNKHYSDMPRAQFDESFLGKQKKMRGQSKGGIGFGDIVNAVTGKQRMTPEMESMSEIGGAPEMNQFSLPAFKASVGLLTESDPATIKNVLSTQFGDKIQFRQDAKGNEIAVLPSGEYAINKPGLSGQDVVRFAFDLASFAPSTRGVSVIWSGLKGAATQAGIEGAGASVGGDFDEDKIPLAGAINVGGKALENVASGVTRAATGSPQSDVVESGRRAGIKVHTSDVIQPKTFAGRMAQQTGEKIPLFGTGAMRESQQAGRESAIRSIADKYGEYSYDTIVSSLKGKKDRIKSAAGSVIQSTGDKLDSAIIESGANAIPLDSTVTAIQKASREFTKPGVLKSEGPLADVQKLIETLSEAPQTFTSLKENRTLFREIANGADKAERSQLTSRAKALLKQIEAGMTADMTSFARQNLTPEEFAKWKRANNVYAAEAQELTKTKLKNILDKGEATPETVKTMLFSRNPSDVRRLYSSLGTEGRTNARAAIISKVVGDLTRQQRGFTPNSFASELKKNGLQIEAFFKGEDRAALNGLMKALDATRRAQDAAVTTPTGQQLLGALGVTGIAIEPVTTVTAAGTVGALARFYESPFVRSVLLRLNSVPRGSTAFDRALSDLQTVLTSSAQTAQNAQ